METLILISCSILGMWNFVITIYDERPVTRIILYFVRSFFIGVLGVIVSELFQNQATIEAQNDLILNYLRILTN
jgi:hypothetical protein